MVPGALISRGAKLLCLNKKLISQSAKHHGRVYWLLVSFWNTSSILPKIKTRMKQRVYMKMWPSTLVAYFQKIYNRYWWNIKCMQLLCNHYLQDTFRNINIALIYYTLPTTGANCKRSVSKLKIMTIVNKKFILCLILLMSLVSFDVSNIFPNTNNRMFDLLEFFDKIKVSAKQ